MSKVEWWTVGCDKGGEGVDVVVVVVVVVTVFFIGGELEMGGFKDGPCPVGEDCLSTALGEPEIAAIGAESLRRYADWPFECGRPYILICISCTGPFRQGPHELWGNRGHSRMPTARVCNKRKALPL